MTPSELKILVAEDNLVNQMVMGKIFKKLGFEIVLAKDGAEASLKGQETAFDLVLMDVNMPGKDGVEVARDIRAAHGDKPVIIALTASVMQQDQDECIQAGMNDFMSKPISKDQLAELLNKWWNGIVPTGEAL